MVCQGTFAVQRPLGGDAGLGGVRAQAVSYLNHMGVPERKLTNITSYPDVMAGYKAEMGCKNC